MAGDEAMQAALMDQTQALLGRVDRALDHGLAAVHLQVGARAMEGAELGDGEGLDGVETVYSQLASIVGKGVEALRQIHELAPDQVPAIELTVGEVVPQGPLAIGPGEVDDQQGPVQDADVVDDVLAGSSAAADASDTPRPRDSRLAPGITRKIRQRQVGTLVKIFGEDRISNIAGLSQEQILALGDAVGNIYRSIEIPARGRPLQETRSRQFVDYIGGLPKDSLESKYGVANVGAMLTTAINILHKQVTPEQLDQIYEAVLTAFDEAKLAQQGA